MPSVRSGVDGAAGADVSTVIESPEEAELVFPAASVAVAVIVWVPDVIEPEVNDQFPLPSAVVVPKVPSTEEITATVELASAVPLNVGVLSLVILSVLDKPESEPAARSGVDGAAGAEVSIVIESPEEAELVFPAASVAVAVIVWVPDVIEPEVNNQFPLPSAVVVPNVPSTEEITVTVELASAVPVNVGVLSYVILSDGRSLNQNRLQNQV